MSIFSVLQREPFTFLFKKMWQFSVSQRHLIVLYSAMFVVANVITLLEPVILAKMLNEIQANGVTEQNIRYLLTLCGVFLVIIIGFWFFHGVARVIEVRNAFLVKVNYQSFLVKNALERNLLWHQVRDSGDILDRINKARDALHSFSASSFIIIQLIVKITGTAIALYFFSGTIAVAVTLLVFTSFYILWNFDKRLIKQYTKLNEFENTVSAKLFDSISNITSILILRIQKTILGNLQKTFITPKETVRLNSALNEWKWATGNFIFQLIIAAPLGFYLWNALQKNQVVEVGTVSALFLYLSGLIYAYFSFAGSYESIIQQKTKVLNALSLEEVVETPVKNAHFKTIESLEINNLSFRYDVESANPAVFVKNLLFKKGEKIAVIGQSGSGKTTFLKVLHGLYENAKGELIVNNHVIVPIGEHDIGTMLVPQDPELFSASIRENITFGVEYSDEYITQFVESARFASTLSRLPKGLESVVNEKGVNLSGGEKQRLALARALLFAQDKNILLLDESTSSVDPENEIAIYKNIFEQYQNTIIIASIHKLNLLKYFDYVVRFEDGAVVDIGTIDVLCGRDPAFKALYEEYRA